ncbi:MAG: MBOAT family protein [Deltaproteobacteria bacterium]|nr:MBOAT family protein [Deltaproteobacteria bacterium]
MLFNTLEFAAFFGVTFVVAWELARLRAVWPRLGFLLVASYSFYSFWSWRYGPLLFGSSTVDYVLAQRIARSRRHSTRRLLLVVTVVSNLGLLAVFKYGAFVTESLRALRPIVGATTAPTADAVIATLPPVGISFFTFVSMAYVIDVYRGRLAPHQSYLRYLVFVAFFPHLVAGPIVRAQDLLPQLERPARLSRRESGEGFFLVALGLVKKVVISDVLSTNLVDRVFADPLHHSAVETLAAVYGYAVQIYCDFSGYSDIAIGLALLLGVRFPANFDAPYQATDLVAFWRRWHISLSSWLRNYLYVPLGGNQGGRLLTYRNLMVTMVLGGLWHGASWTFVSWGALHGLGLVVVRVLGGETGSGAPQRSVAERLAAWFVTFHFVCFAWVFFRASSFHNAAAVFRQLGARGGGAGLLSPLMTGWLAMSLAALSVPRRVVGSLRERFIGLPAWLQGGVLFLVAVLLHEVSSAERVPFIYFQF